tara:strand:+ start:3160 stop:3567 length:408 start_codon:yes stop_codon:yes gene_type:complete
MKTFNLDQLRLAKTKKENYITVIGYDRVSEEIICARMEVQGLTQTLHLGKLPKSDVTIYPSLRMLHDSLNDQETPGMGEDLIKTIAHLANIGISHELWNEQRYGTIDWTKSHILENGECDMYVSYPTAKFNSCMP